MREMRVLQIGNCLQRMQSSNHFRSLALRRGVSPAPWSPGTRGDLLSGAGLLRGVSTVDIKEIVTASAECAGVMEDGPGSDPIPKKNNSRLTKWLGGGGAASPSHPAIASPVDISLCLTNQVSNLHSNHQDVMTTPIPAVLFLYHVCVIVSNVGQWLRGRIPDPAGVDTHSATGRQWRSLMV